MATPEIAPEVAAPAAPPPSADGEVLVAEADVAVAQPVDADADETSDTAMLAELLAAAQAARQSGDPDEALRNWAAARARVPSHPAAFRNAANLLQELGRADEAVAVLEAGRTAFPADLGIAADHAWASHRRHWNDALASWAHLRETFPGETIGYVGAAVTLRDINRYAEAEAILREAQACFADDVAVLRELGWVAQARRDWPEAEQRWQALRERFPDETAGYVLGAAALREQDRLVEAEALLKNAVDRFPDNAWPASDHAWLAHRRKDWPEAIARWQQVRARFPNQSVWGGAVALREAGDLEAADAWLTELLPRHSQDFSALMEYAQIAQLRGDWKEALRRWSTLRSRFPNNPLAHVREATALRTLGRHQEADALLQAGMARLPDDASLVVAYAQGAHEAADWPEAARRWALVCASRTPRLGYLPASSALRNLGRLDEAEAVLAEGMQRFPENLDLTIEFAWFAHRREDWAEAAKRWQTVRERSPQNPIGWLLAGLALRAARKLDEAEALLQAGAEQHPSDSRFPVELALAATLSRDWEQAVTRWENVRERFPDAREAYTHGAHALRELGRQSEAEQLLKAAARRFPDSEEPSSGNHRAKSGR